MSHIPPYGSLVLKSCCLQIAMLSGFTTKQELFM